MPTINLTKFFCSFLAALTAVFIPLSAFSSVITPREIVVPFQSAQNTGQTIDTAVANEVIVKFKAGKENALQAIVQKYSVDRIRNGFLNTRSIRINSLSALQQTLTELNADPAVEYAEPNYIAHAYALPNDPLFTQYQWDLGPNGFDMEKVWDIATGRGVTVAVVDTGVAYEDYSGFKRAPDLAQTAFTTGYNALATSASRRSHANDDNGHGTHVTGTIAQSTNNGLGAAGIAYNATIMPVKVLDATGAGTYADIANGIVWAADHGAHIINLSLGGPSPSQTLRDALSYAASKGVLIVAAAGNDGGTEVGYPAAYDEYVTAVGATGSDGNLAPYSNRGTALDIVAPGGNTKIDSDGNGYGDGILQQTFPQGSPANFGYYFFQGTSMATPHVVGIAALIREAGITDPGRIKNILLATADDLGQAGRDNDTGYGLANPMNALLRAKTDVNSLQGGLSQSPSPIPTPTPLPSPPPTSGPSPTPSPTPSPSAPTLEPRAKNTYVAKITLDIQRSFLRFQANATVRVLNNLGNPVSNATVSGAWSGAVKGASSAKTNADGYAVLASKSGWLTQNMNLVFSVTNIKHSQLSYAPNMNVITEKSFTVSRANCTNTLAICSFMNRMSESYPQVINEIQNFNQ